MLVKAISAQTNIQVSGHLTDISTSTPVPNHYVSVFVHPYSLGVAPYYADSVLTNSAGYYSFNFMLPTPVDSLFVLKVGTFECNGNWAHETFDNTNGQTNFSSDLFICDSIYQNLNCHGAIEWPGYQNLTVTLHGYGWPDPDFYNWDLGDGTYATGQNVIHTYSTHQRYTIGLTTTNFPDSCTHSSIATVDLSTTSDCESSFSYSRQDQFTVNFQGSTNSQYPTQFSWDFGDGTSGSSQIVSHTYATIGSYNAVLITLDSIGCS
jgi:chitodextrinase